MAKKNKVKAKSREPLRYDPPFELEETVEKPSQKYRVTLVYLLDQDEVNGLIDASNAQYTEPNRLPSSTDYPTYSEEECVALINGKYRQRKFKKKSKI